MEAFIDMLNEMNELFFKVTLSENNYAVFEIVRRIAIEQFAKSSCKLFNLLDAIQVKYISHQYACSINLIEEFRKEAFNLYEHKILKEQEQEQNQ